MLTRLPSSHWIFDSDGRMQRYLYRKRRTECAALLRGNVTGKAAPGHSDHYDRFRLRGCAAGSEQSRKIQTPVRDFARYLNALPVMEEEEE